MAQYIADDDENNLVQPADVEAPPTTDEVPEGPASPEATQTAEDGDVDNEVADNEDTADEFTPVAAGPVHGHSVKSPHPYQRYADMLGSYQDLINKRNSNNAMLGVLAGGQIAGQAIAGGRSGKFDTDLSNIKMLQDMNNQGVQDYTNSVKQQGLDINLKDMQQMRDPTSKVSEFYRGMAKQRGLPITPDMSAFDIQNMAKVIGKPGQAKWRSTQMINQKTSEVMQGKIDQLTGKIYDANDQPLGSDWVEHSKAANRTFVDPKTQERMGFDSTTGKTTGFKTGPGITAPVMPPSGAQNGEQPEFELNRSYLNTQQAKQLDTERKTFDNDVKDNRNAIVAAQRVLDNLKLGKKVGADDVAEIRNQLALAYGQKGHITDTSLTRTLAKPDWQSQFDSATSLATKGTLDDANRQWLMQMAQGLKNQNQKFLVQKAAVHTNNLYQDWATSPNLSKYKINPDHVAKMLSVEQAAMKPDMVYVKGADSGRTFAVTADQAKNLIASKKFTSVSGPSAPAAAPSPTQSEPEQTAGPEEDEEE